jgi:hypothetical protein
MPLMKLDSSRSGSPAALMSGDPDQQPRSMALISRRARYAPRQKSGPADPKPTCGLGDRVMPKSLPLWNTDSWLLADPAARADSATRIRLHAHLLRGLKALTADSARRGVDDPTPLTHVTGRPLRAHH